MKDNLLLMVISSNNTLLIKIVLLKMHDIAHSRNNSPVWFAQCIRPDRPYSNHRVWSFPVGLELTVYWVGRVFKDPS